MDDYSDNIDQQLLEAYLNTDYQINNPNISIQIGQHSSSLDRLLMDNNAYCWSIISAWNPFSKALSKELNDQRHQKLIDLLNKRDFSYKLGWGIPKNLDWESEKLVLILDITYEDALALGKYFEQNAIIVGNLNDEAKLVLCV